MTERKRVGKYEIIEEIGRGGFAVVYKARDTELDRIVALKVLYPCWTADQAFAARFRREARAAARLSHPSIVTVYEAGEAQGQLYIAMEYLPGCTLRELLMAEDALPLERALPILEQVADALDYAHGEGVIHRDVKPANVIVERTDRGVRATLTDFGLVKAMESSVALTSQGTLLGSPEYMAPEQADPEQADEVGPAADLYALGVAAYRMLTGRVPFPGNTPATLNAHVRKRVPPPRSLRSDLSRSVQSALLRMLAKKPARRFDSARAFVSELREALLHPQHVRIPKWALGVVGLILVLLSGGRLFALKPFPVWPTHSELPTQTPISSVNVITETSVPWIVTSVPNPAARASAAFRSSLTVTPCPTPTATRRTPTPTLVTPTSTSSPTLTLVPPKPTPSLTPTPTAVTSTPTPSSTPTPAAVTSTPTPSLTPTPAAVTSTPTPSSSPRGQPVRIFYTVEAGQIYYLASTDPSRSQGELLDPIAYESSTCAGGTEARTLAGQSVRMFYGYRCPIVPPVVECTSPDGQYSATVWHSEGQYSMSIRRASDDTMVQAVYTGNQLNSNEYILWAPDSSWFYFTLDNTLHRASPNAAGYQPVLPIAYETSISPDGSMILYLQPVGIVGAYDVWVANADGSNQHNVTNAPDTYKLCARWGSMQVR